MDGREHRYFILAASTLPLLGVALAIMLSWNRLVSATDMIALAAMYVVCGFGVSVGFHRLLAHRSFVTPRWMRNTLAVAGTMAGQGPPIIWAAHHRRHHRVADKDGDPHSPYLDGEPGLAGALKGLWHSHLGWLLDEKLTSDPMRYCPDLARDRDLRWISNHFLLVVAAGLALPAAIGFALTGTAAGAAAALLWGGVVRIFVLNHITYAVNSVGHYFGRRSFDTPDESRNVAWLALPSFGEAWHNNHHAFPRSASHGLRWYQLDVSALFIRALERVGLATRVIRIDPEAQGTRAAVLARRGGGRQAPSQPPAPLAERDRDRALAGVSDVE